MRLLEYIDRYEKVRSRPITNSEAEKTIRSMCSDALRAANIGFMIWRGNVNLGGYAYFIDPSAGVDRISPYAHKNFYNLLLSNLPSWNKYPKRNKSIIATTDRSDARSRSEGQGAYLVLPKNGGKIGICPADDIWRSFTDIKPLNALNRTLIKLFEYIGASSSITDRAEKDYKTFVKLCSMVDDFDIENFETKESYYEVSLDDYFDMSNRNLIRYLDDMLDPDYNGFELIRVGKVFSRNRGLEVWTDAPSVLINERSPLIEELGIVLE